MNRRQFLALGTGGVGFLAGCQTDTGDGAESEPGPTNASATPAETVAATATPTDTSSTIVVDPDGADSNPGTPDAPVASIQEALDRADPGTTVSLTAGVHTNGDPDRPVGITRRGGEPGEPIRIVGPPEAVVRGPPTEFSTKPLFHVTHSHVHIEGMTLDGLTKPERGDEHRWYRNQLVTCNPPTWQSSYPDYLTDVAIRPRKVGNARRKLVSSYRTNDLDIGGFEVVGLAGADYFVGGKDGYVLGAIVSLGRSSNNFGTSHYPWEGPDESHNIRVHHIAHRDDHQHTELVKTHAGNYDVTIEYCTDPGGMTRSGVHLPGAQSTVRWCVLTNSPRNGVSVSIPPMKENGAYEAFETIPEERFPGRNNAIYGNRLVGNEEGAVGFSSPEWFENGRSDQRVICGNVTDADTESSCPASIQDGDGIGHAGGDSPWA